MNGARLYRITRIVCLLSAAVGVGVTVIYAVMTSAACCDTTFIYITGQFVGDFVVAPLLAGLSLRKFGTAGRIIFWASCAWMTVVTRPPFLILLAALCIWTRVRIKEEIGDVQAVL